MTKGIYFAVIAAIISGISIFLNKFAVAAISPPIVFTATKNLGVGLLILGLILLTGKFRQIKKLSKKELFQLSLIALIGGSLPFYLFFTGLSQVSAVNSAMIHKSLVFWVAILALPLLKERLSRIQILAVVLLFISNYFIPGFSGFQFSRGELFILIATILWAGETILVKKLLPQIDPDIALAFRMGLGSLILIIASAVIYPGAIMKITALNSTQWFWLLLTAVLLFSYVFTWYRALKYASAILVSAILVSSTLITNILSAIFINHSWSFIFSPPPYFIIFGLILLILSLSKRKDFFLQPE